MKAVLFVLCLLGVQAQAGTFQCEGDLRSPNGPKVVVILEGHPYPEQATRLNIAAFDRQTGQPTFQRDYALQKVADYQKGSAYRFRVSTDIIGIVDFFSGRGSLYVNAPTVFTGLFQGRTECRRN